MQRRYVYNLMNVCNPRNHHSRQEIEHFWMDLETTILSEVKSDRERQISDDIVSMWNLKKTDTSELISKTEIDPQT